MAIVLVVIVLVMLIVGDAAKGPTRCVASVEWFGCVLNAHEALAAGLIAAAGGIFAAWLAYRAAKDQIALAQRDALLARRAEANREFDELAADIDKLQTAGAYLLAVAKDFPNSDQESGFARHLRGMRELAGDALSATASSAPFGYGERISSVITRVQMLGERMAGQIDRKVPAGSVEQLADPEVKKLVAGLRTMAQQIKDELPRREQRLLALKDERDELAKRIGLSEV